MTIDEEPTAGKSAIPPERGESGMTPLEKAAAIAAILSGVASALYIVLVVLGLPA